MSLSPQKRRKLRLSDSEAKNAALLYDFDHVNKLIHEDARIRLDFVSKVSHSCPYEHFGEACKIPSQTINLDLSVRRSEEELPRRRRRITADPLHDEVYETFHRRMKKEERSRTLTDRGRMYFEMDNLKSQLELLQQHDWNKHLPTLTKINDRSDVDELLKKRQATMHEIEKTLAKFANWEARSSALSAEMKVWENQALARKRVDDDDADDVDETVLDVPLHVLAKERRQQRIARDGMPIRILLRNGHQVRYNPYLTPTVVVEREKSR
ncbi:hypothetical protein HF325_001648 [Metschnikowia pulcherrima]|uniref:Something about silencing protein 4 domain-containing protein n=1 Tax=Metschnikowia pulcherrima TaxID=27326 RepID=A0A8H7LE32_9ASCO|nr:hypothetical protein HF325_001648 [Metschnikowia pulcherrima]